MYLKAVFYCATNWQKWGKGKTIQEAKKNAGLGKTIQKDTQYYVQAAVFNAEGMTDAEYDNLLTCITADPDHGAPMYYNIERTDEDTAMIEKYHVGWLMVERVGC